MEVAPELCTICQKNQTSIRCDICHEPSCKTCSVFIDGTDYEFIELMPESICNKGFCSNCYTNHAAAQIDVFTETLDRAKAVSIYGADQGSETRLMRRVEKPIKVNDCVSRNDAQIRLAFQAAKMGYDTLVDVELTSKKVANGTYIKLTWDGRGIPIDSNKGK